MLFWWLLWNTWYMLFCQRNRSNYKTPLTPAPTPPQYSMYNCNWSFRPCQIYSRYMFRKLFCWNKDNFFTLQLKFFCNSINVTFHCFVPLPDFLKQNISLNWFCCILANSLFCRYVCNYCLAHTIPQSNTQYVCYATYRSNKCQPLTHCLYAGTFSDMCVNQNSHRT